MRREEIDAGVPFTIAVNREVSACLLSDLDNDPTLFPSLFKHVEIEA